MEKLNRHKLGFYCLLLTAYCLLSVSGCFLKPPAAPSWETTINIPLISQKITLDSLINEIDGIDTIGGCISYSCKIEFDTITIGDMELDTTLSFSELFSLLVIFGDSLRNYQGMTIPFIPNTSFTHDSTIILDSRLNYFTISEGELELKLKNMLPVALDSGKITLTDTLGNNSIIELVRTLSAYDSLVYTESLEGKTIMGTIRSSIELYTESTDNVLIDTTDYFSIEVKLSNLKVSEINGDLDSLSIPIPSMGYRFEDANEIPDSIFLKGVTIKLNLHKEVNFGLDINYTLQGYKQQERVTVLPLSLTIPRDSVNVIEEWSGPDIDDFLNAHSDSICGEGAAIAKDSGSANADDKIWGSIAFDVPFVFKIGSPVDYEPKPVEVKIDEGTRNNIKERCVEGMLVLTLENHLPIHGDIKIYASEDTLSGWKALDTLILPECNIGPDSTVETSVSLTDTVELSGEKLDIFTYSPVFIKFKLHLGETDGYVKATRDDYLKFRSLLSIKVLVGEK